MYVKYSSYVWNTRNIPWSMDASVLALYRLARFTTVAPVAYVATMKSAHSEYNFYLDVPECSYE